MTEITKDVLLLTIYTLVNDCVMDSGAKFRTTLIMNNYYVANDFEKVYLADGQLLDVMGLGDVGIK